MDLNLILINSKSIFYNMIAANNVSKKLYFSGVKFYQVANELSNLMPSSNVNSNLMPSSNVNSLNSTSEYRRFNSKPTIFPNRLSFRSDYSFSSNNIPKQALNQLLNHPYSRLCRWDKPIGALLLYWPCLWGI